MKLLIPIIFISVTISAQQKEKLPAPQRLEKDKKLESFDKEMKLNETQNRMYKMPCAKADEYAYSSLRDKRKDTTDYKILNALIPQKHFEGK